MSPEEWLTVRVLLADREAFATYDHGTLTAEQRAALVRGLKVRGRGSDARKVPS